MSLTLDVRHYLLFVEDPPKEDYPLSVKSPPYQGGVSAGRGGSLLKH